MMPRLEINASTCSLPIAEARGLRPLWPPDLASVLGARTLLRWARGVARGALDGVEFGGRFGGSRRLAARVPLLFALTRHG
jgi:hypothetical protein